MNKTSIFKRLTFEQQRISFSCEQMYRTDTQTSFFPELFIFFFSFWMYYIVVISYGSSLPHYDLYSLELFEYLLIDQKVICFCQLTITSDIFFLAQRTHFFCLEINAVLKIVHDVFLWIVLMWILLFADCLTMDKLMSVQNVEDEEMCMFKM